MVQVQRCGRCCRIDSPYAALTFGLYVAKLGEKLIHTASFYLALGCSSFWRWRIKLIRRRLQAPASLIVVMRLSFLHIRRLGLAQLWGVDLDVVEPNGPSAGIFFDDVCPDSGTPQPAFQHGQPCDILGLLVRSQLVEQFLVGIVASRHRTEVEIFVIEERSETLRALLRRTRQPAMLGGLHFPGRPVPLVDSRRVRDKNIAQGGEGIQVPEHPVGNVFLPAQHQHS